MELTAELIKRRSKQFDLGCITLLDLSGAGLRRLGDLDECVSVIKLNLSNNEIAELDGLPVLMSLLSLDLSKNRLNSIDDLPRFPALEELVLSDNQIMSADFKLLATRLPKLRKLHLERNPVEAKSTFVQSIRSAFPNLMTLNGEALAFYEALSQDTGSTKALSPPSTAAAVDSPAKSGFKPGFSLQLPAFDAEKFASETSKRLEEMLREAKQTLESESKRVEQAFCLLET